MAVNMGPYSDDQIKTAVPPTLHSFSFTATPRLRPLSFCAPTSQSFKRHRPLSDVDGENSQSQHCKKRRLRLLLITSRLSRPFSLPPTHIIYRDSSKVAIWAKKKALGRSILRKSAILNSIRRSNIFQSEELLRQFGRIDLHAFKRELSDIERQTLIYGTQDPYTHPVSAPSNPEAALSPAPELQSPNFEASTSFQPIDRLLPPSVSNYDALDREDELSYHDFADYEEGEGDDGTSDPSTMIYSDFSFINSSQDEEEDDVYGFPGVFPMPFFESTPPTDAGRDRLGGVSAMHPESSDDRSQQQQLVMSNS